MAERSNDVLTVNMREYVKLIQFASETHLPFCVWGEKAVGKTTAVYDWCEKNGFRCVALHLATQDVVDLIGMMKEEEVEIGKDDKGNPLTISQTKWARPEWMVPENDPTPTCYFLDEFNRGNQFVLAAMLPFLIEGKMHTHTIGKHDFVIAACNPTTGNYNVNDSFEADDALRDRCGHVILEPSKDEFIDYASTFLGVTSMKVIQKEDSFSKLNKFKMPFEVKPSRRSLINVLKHVDNRPDEWVKHTAHIVLSAYLGHDLTSAWLSQYTDKLEALDLRTLMNFDANKELIENTISVRVKNKLEVKNDIFEGAQDIIVDYLSSKYKDGIDDIEWLIKFFSIPVVQRDSIVAMLTKFVTLDKPNLLSRIMDSGLLDGLETIAEHKENTEKMEVNLNANQD